MQVANLAKTDLLARVAARGKALEQDATNPHRGIDVLENATDEVLIKRAGGNTLGEMRAVAQAVNKVYQRQGLTTGFLAGGCGLAGYAAVYLGAGALAIPAFTGGSALGLLACHLLMRTGPNQAVLTTLNRWQAALEAEPGGRPGGPGHACDPGS
ncbi:MAG: hypothetical protein ACYCW6_22920 [Candidatus Xenobia bacterium]